LSIFEKVKYTKDSSTFFNSLTITHYKSKSFMSVQLDLPVRTSPKLSSEKSMMRNISASSITSLGENSKCSSEEYALPLGKLKRSHDGLLSDLKGISGKSLKKGKRSSIKVESTETVVDFSCLFQVIKDTSSSNSMFWNTIFTMESEVLSDI